MAHTKAKGTSKLGRDSASQRLGIKKYAGEIVHCGDIIIRQRGTKFHPGDNTFAGKDDTIVAKKDGKVVIKKKKTIAFTGRMTTRSFVCVQ